MTDEPYTVADLQSFLALLDGMRKWAPAEFHESWSPQLSDRLRRLIVTALAALKDRDEHSREIRRMCGTMTSEDLHTEERHRSELDRVERTVERRTSEAIASWLERRADMLRPESPHNAAGCLNASRAIRANEWKADR